MKNGIKVLKVHCSSEYSNNVSGKNSQYQSPEDSGCLFCDFTPTIPQHGFHGSRFHLSIPQMPNSFPNDAAPNGTVYAVHLTVPAQ